MYFVPAFLSIKLLPHTKYHSIRYHQELSFDTNNVLYKEAAFAKMLVKVSHLWSQRTHTTNHGNSDIKLVIWYLCARIVYDTLHFNFNAACCFDLVTF